MSNIYEPVKDFVSRVHGFDGPLREFFAEHPDLALNICMYQEKMMCIVLESLKAAETHNERLREEIDAWIEE
jgi:hypothetical protein